MTTNTATAAEYVLWIHTDQTTSNVHAQLNRPGHLMGQIEVFPSLDDAVAWAAAIEDVNPGDTVTVMHPGFAADLVAELPTADREALEAATREQRRVAGAMLPGAVCNAGMVAANRCTRAIEASRDITDRGLIESAFVRLIRTTAEA